MGNNKNIIYLPKDRYKTLENFYKNFDSMKEFMELVLSPDEYDCWLYQNQYIKDTYFGDKPIYKIKSKPSTRITIVDDVVSRKHKPKISDEDLQRYFDSWKNRTGGR